MVVKIKLKVVLLSAVLGCAIAYFFNSVLFGAVLAVIVFFAFSPTKHKKVKRKVRSI